MLLHAKNDAMSVSFDEVTTKGPIDLTDEHLVQITRDPASFVSGPLLSKGATIAPNVLEFQLVTVQHFR